MARVVIEFVNEMSLSESEIRYTLMDALAEFQSNRGPSSAEYVNRRYPIGSGVYEGIDRDEKITQVYSRKRVAEEMRCSITIVEP